MNSNPWIEFVRMNRGSGKTLKALSKEYRIKNPDCCKPRSKKGKKGRPRSPTPRHSGFPKLHPPDSPQDKIVSIAPTGATSITKEELSRLKNRRMTDARAAAGKRREASKKQKEGMSRAELLAATKDGQNQLKKRKKRVENKMIEALEKQGVAAPKKDPRWKGFKKQLDADFEEKMQNIEKKYRPARRSSNFDIAALNAQFEDDEDEDDEDFVPR